MGVFANALSLAVGRRPFPHRTAAPKRVGLAAWLLDRFQRRATQQPRLVLAERILLAPRQTLALIEADGQRLLVATSPEGAPAFYPLPSISIAHGPSRSRKTAAEGKLP